MHGQTWPATIEEDKLPNSNCFWMPVIWMSAVFDICTLLVLDKIWREHITRRV